MVTIPLSGGNGRVHGGVRTRGCARRLSFRCDRPGGLRVRTRGCAQQLSSRCGQTGVHSGSRLAVAHGGSPSGAVSRLGIGSGLAIAHDSPPLGRRQTGGTTTQDSRLRTAALLSGTDEQGSRRLRTRDYARQPSSRHVVADSTGSRLAITHVSTPFSTVNTGHGGSGLAITHDSLPPAVRADSGRGGSGLAVAHDGGLPSLLRTCGNHRSGRPGVVGWMRIVGSPRGVAPP
jgi:hypothetical protein